MVPELHALATATTDGRAIIWSFSAKVVGWVLSAEAV
jgi:hypothetical protein